MHRKTLLFALTLVGCSVLVAQEEGRRDKTPALGKEAFASRLKDLYYEDGPSQVEEIEISGQTEKEFFLNNLAHLKKLRKIEFEKISFTGTDIAKVAQFPNVKQIGLAGYTSIDLAKLSPLKTLEAISFSRCKAIDWRELKNLPARKLRTLAVSNSELGHEDIRLLSEIPTIESIELSSLSGLAETNLNNLGRFGNLTSLSIYNCPNVAGMFLASLEDLKIREFNYTGALSPEHAVKLANFRDLESVQLNVKQPLDEKWFAAIAANCQKLKRVRLMHQGADQRKIDLLSSLPNLTHLELHSGSFVPDLPGRRAKVPSRAGVFRKLSRLNKLKTLRISGTYKLSAEDGAAITSLANLRDLELRDVTFEDGVFAKLDGLVDLRSLIIYGSKRLSEADSKQIANLSRLESLDLTDITTKGADFSTLGKLNHLKELNVSGYAGFNDRDMTFAKSATKLQKLTMKNNFRVTDKGLAQLKHATTLKELFISKARINGSGFAHWPPSHSIGSIFIEGCSISNEGVKALSRLQNLKSLEVRVIQFAEIEVDVSCFTNSKSLEHVSLLGSYITSKDSVDRLIKARPKMGVFCRTK